MVYRNSCGRNSYSPLGRWNCYRSRDASGTRLQSGSRRHDAHEKNGAFLRSLPLGGLAIALGGRRAKDTMSQAKALRKVTLTSASWRHPSHAAKASDAAIQAPLMTAARRRLGAVPRCAVSRSRANSPSNGPRNAAQSGFTGQEYDGAIDSSCCATDHHAWPDPAEPRVLQRESPVPLLPSFQVPDCRRIRRRRTPRTTSGTLTKPLTRASRPATPPRRRSRTGPSGRSVLKPPA
jgi:hypothetical protein